MALLLALISYGMSVVAVGLFSVKALEMYRRIKAGQPDPTRSNEKGKRLALMTKEVLGHTKMLNFTGSGIAHWFVMIGFVALFGTLVTAYGQVLDPAFLLPVIGKWDPYVYFVLAIAWLTGVSIVALIGIRQVTRFVRKGRTSRFFGSYSGRAYFVEAVILVIVICVIWLHQLEVALIEGEDVGLEGAEQLLFGNVPNVLVGVLFAGIVDEDIEPSEGIDRLRDRAVAHLP